MLGMVSRTSNDFDKLFLFVAVQIQALTRPYFFGEVGLGKVIGDVFFYLEEIKLDKFF
jgi:hypothetical protein